MNFKRITAFGAAAMMIMTGFAGCEKTQTEDTADTAAQADNTQAQEDAVILNFTAPEVGEKIAVMTVKDYGEIKIKLFPEQASKGVENFIGLAEMNYYDELIFHRVINGFMNQGGDPTGTGTGGNSIWGGNFDGGVPEGLYHFSGAVAYANSQGTSTNSSQFYIVNTAEGDVLGGEDYLVDLPANLADMYREKGGTPHLDGSYTVFGQVFEGMDVVRAISEVETDENDKPLTQVLIESVRIVEYTGE